MGPWGRVGRQVTVRLLLEGEGGEVQDVRLVSTGEGAAVPRLWQSRGRPGHATESISRLAWGCLWVLLDELVDVAREGEVWTSLLRLLPR